MGIEQKVQEVSGAFTALDKARSQFTEELIKAANQALGMELFIRGGYVRHVQGVDISLTARIPCEYPSSFYDGGS